MPSAEKYFPRTISKSVAGNVSRSSSVPCLRSSAQIAMATAGTKKSSR